MTEKKEMLLIEKTQWEAIVSKVRDLTLKVSILKDKCVAQPQYYNNKELGAPDKPCGEAVQTLTQNCCQTIHEEWYVFDSFHLCTEAFDL